nr:hypothetical protein [Fimbriiglobus ruber]
MTGGHAERGRVYRLTRQTTRPSVWRVATAIVWVADRKHTLMVARNDATGEIKYFLTNATAEPVARILAVAFRRWTVEHLFRVAKQEVGLMHYEGRDYTGLMRHRTLAVVVLGFVAAHTERLRGKNPDVTMEQVCRALNVRCAILFRRRRGTGATQHTSDVIQYHQRRNKQATRSHKKQRHKRVT